MSGRGDPIEVQKCRSTLLTLLKQPQNSTCADCGRKQPTWASTNLGVFVCIGCSGIHRNLGTHISKVKSVNLDSWTYRLLNHFKAQGGNESVNSRYECKLPSSLKPDTGATSHMMEGFIRNKYQHRKWFSDTPRERREVPSRKNNERKERRRRRKAAEAAATSQSSSSSSATTKQQQQPIVEQKKQDPPPPAQVLPDLLDVSSLEPKHDDLLSFEPAAAAPPVVQQTHHQPSIPAAAPSSSFGFINSSGAGGNDIGGLIGASPMGPTSGNAFGLSNGPTPTAVAATGPTSNGGGGFDFSVPVESSKTSIMSKFHEDPFRPGGQQHPQMSSDFMTQLNVPMQRQPVVVQQQQQASPLYGMGMGFPQQMGNGNPYTMLNNAAQPQRRQMQHHPHSQTSPYGFGFR